MLFAALVYFIIKRSRKRLASREATIMGTDRMQPRTEHGNALNLVDIRSGRIGGYRIALPYGVPSEESLVKEPSPAYMPAQGYARCMKGIQVSTEDPFYSSQH